MVGTDRPASPGDLEERLKSSSGPEERAAAMADLAWAVKYSDPSRAIRLADEALELCKGTGTRNSLPKCFMAKAMGLLHRSRFIEAEGAAGQGLEAYRELDDPSGIRHGLNVLGSVYFRWGKYAEALKHYREALDIHMRISDGPDPGILSNIGGVYLQLGETEKALKCYSSVYDMAKGAEGPSDLKAATLINLSEIYGIMNMHEARLEHLNAAWEIAVEGSMKQAMAVILDDTASVLVDLERCGEARENFLRSLEMFREMEDVKGEALVLLHLGRCSLLCGTDDAMDNYLRSNSIFKSINDSQGAADTHIGIARVHAGEGNIEEALSNLAEALEIAGNKGLKPQLSKIHQDLSKIFEERGEYEKALMHIKLHHEIEERLRSERAANRIRNLRIVHQVEEVRREAAFYRLKNLELERENLRLQSTVEEIGDEGSVPEAAEEGTDRVGDIFDSDIEHQLLLERVRKLSEELNGLLTMAIESAESLQKEEIPPSAAVRLDSVVDSVRSAFPVVKNLSVIAGPEGQMEQPEDEAVNSHFVEYTSLGGFSTESAIMVVEDDTDITELLITAFEANGYPVIVASTVKRAREILQEGGNRIGCVFVDVLLPDGSGIELLKEIREKDASMPLIAGSGYPIAPRDREYLKDNRIVFLQKPYSIDSLMLNLSTMLPT